MGLGLVVRNCCGLVGLEMGGACLNFLFLCGFGVDFGCGWVDSVFFFIC